MEHDEGAEPQERSLAGEVVAHLPELWLVACAYEYMAAGTLCKTCGSPLGNGTQMLIGAETGVAGGVMVTTACRGRRRHQHVATVRERSGDLLFGGFERRWNRRRLRKTLRDAGAVVDSNWTGQQGDVA
ncbi:MAG: hypothetical protein ABSB68_17600 [Acidimicrobiales bacterium]